LVGYSQRQNSRLSQRTSRHWISTGWHAPGSTKPEFLPEFGVFLAEPVSEELLQTRILFFSFHQILELVALWCLPGSPLPPIVRLFSYSCLLDSVLDACSPTCLVSISPSFWASSFSEYVFRAVRTVGEATASGEDSCAPGSAVLVRIARACRPVALFGFDAFFSLSVPQPCEIRAIGLFGVARLH
jgi:hypothetical protein